MNTCEGAIGRGTTQASQGRAPERLPLFHPKCQAGAAKLLLAHVHGSPGIHRGCVGRPCGQICWPLLLRGLPQRTADAL